VWHDKSRVEIDPPPPRMRVSPKELPNNPGLAYGLYTYTRSLKNVRLGVARFLRDQLPLPHSPVQEHRRPPPEPQSGRKATLISRARGGMVVERESLIAEASESYSADQSPHPAVDPFGVGGSCGFYCIVVLLCLDRLTRRSRLYIYVMSSSAVRPLGPRPPASPGTFWYGFLAKGGEESTIYA
jgi:hypothetical protein